MKAAAAAVVLLLLLAFGAWKQQDAPLVVTCSTVTGGSTATVKGIDLGLKAGGWLNNIVENPEQYEDPDNIRRTLDGMFRKVLWYWVTSFVQSARGEKIDPQILRLQEERDAALADAAAACCPADTPPPPPVDEGTEDDWDPRTASLAKGFSRENLEIARVVIREQKAAGLPARASVVALAAAMQESGPNGPRNLSYGHSSSVGAWQLINSHGTVAQRMDPTFSVRWFYGQLTAINGWEQLSINNAAWRVEQPRADLRGLYGQWEDDARRLVAAVGGTAPAAEEAPEYTAGACTPAGEVSEGAPGGATVVVGTPGGWNYGGQRTVDQAIAWMKAQDASNSGGWQARCLAAVGQAYGHAGTTRVNGHYYAIDQFYAQPASVRQTQGDPPRGALVFWKTGSAAGHIAISNGDGRVWTTDPPGRTGQIGLAEITAIDTWGTRVGWIPPKFYGKTEA